MSAHTVEDRGHATPCWIWSGYICDRGYGQVTVDGRRLYAHRVVYVRDRGPIPEGLTLDHLCRQRACVNPAHLEPVTRGENCRRGARAKITQAIADDIRRRVASGARQKDLAAEYGIAACTVSNIVAGRGWS